MSNDPKNKLDHPCKETCSGWKQGFEQGLAFSTTTQDDERDAREWANKFNEGYWGNAHQSFLAGRNRTKNKCGFCIQGKPCNYDRCPNDTVLAADYNALSERIKKLEVALSRDRGINRRLANRNMDLTALLLRAKISLHQADEIIYSSMCAGEIEENPGYANLISDIEVGIKGNKALK